MRTWVITMSAALLTGLFLTTPVQAESLGQGLTRLVEKIQRNWKPDCKRPGVTEVNIVLKFTLAPNGHLSEGPEWVKPRVEPVWVDVAESALAAFKQGEPYTDLPQGLYNVPIEISFNAHRACAHD